MLAYVEMLMFMNNCKCVCQVLCVKQIPHLLYLLKVSFVYLLMSTLMPALVTSQQAWIKSYAHLFQQNRAHLTARHEHLFVMKTQDKNVLRGIKCMAYCQ